MLVRCHHDPREFFDLVSPFLVSHEAENALPLGMARSFVDLAMHDGLMFSVESGRDVVAAALKAPKRNLVVTRGPETAMRALARYAESYALPVPGLNGPIESVRAFCDEWTTLTGQQCVDRMSLRLFQLTRVRDDSVDRPAVGSFRYATVADRAIVETWLYEFIDEASHDHHTNVRDRVAQLLDGTYVGLWSDTEQKPVAMAAITRRSPRSSLVSWVYTAKDARNKGFATACVSELSRREIAAGRSFCTLYADAGSEASNALYRRIGYEPICEALDVTFH